METSCSTISRLNPDLVVCRYKPGAKVDHNSARENLLARMAFPGEAQHAVVTIFPKDAVVDLSLFDEDQYADGNVQARTRLLAFVAECTEMQAAIHRYFACRPTHLNKRVFCSEAAALAWVSKELAAM